jgi:hypothetical protein
MCIGFGWYLITLPELIPPFLLVFIDQVALPLVSGQHLVPLLDVFAGFKIDQ